MRGNMSTYGKIGLLSAVLVIGGLAGCATGNSDVLPASLQERLTAQATADDYLEAARLYEAQADALKTKAAQLEERAQALHAKPYLDPKGLKRDSLSRLAGSYRGQAQGLEQQYAIYRAKAETFMTQQDSQGGARTGS